MNDPAENSQRDARPARGRLFTPLLAGEADCSRRSSPERQIVHAAPRRRGRLLTTCRVSCLELFMQRFWGWCTPSEHEGKRSLKLAPRVTGLREPRVRIKRL